MYSSIQTPIDPRTPSQPNRKRPRKSDRKPPTTQESKLQSVVDMMEEKNLDMQHLLRALAKHRSEKRYHRYWLQFRRFAYQEMLDEKENNPLPRLDGQDWDNMLKAGGNARYQRQFRKELAKLANSKHFRWEFPDPNTQTLGFIDRLGSLVDVVRNTAPSLVKLLSSVARPSDHPSSKPIPMGIKQTMWVSMLLFSMQSSRCSGLARTLALYLMDSGVKKRVIDVLSTLNVCVCYSTAQSLGKHLAVLGENEVGLNTSSEKQAKSYDNFDFVDHKSAERLGSRKTQRGITTVLQFQAIMIPDGGLRQDMWRPNHEVRVQDIVVVNRNTKKLFHQSRRHFVHEGLKTTFPKGFPEKRLIECNESMKMPEIKRIAYNRTKSHPLAPVQQDESTTEGNILIHEDIEERQLKKDPNDPMWNHILLLYYGDLKTILRILAVQSCRRDAERSYDSRKWMIPGLGLWHLRLNLLRLIHKNHWGGSKPTDGSTLQYAADAWKRSNVNTGQDFTKLEALLVHSYQARVSAVMMHLCNNRRGKTAPIQSTSNRQWKAAPIQSASSFEGWLKRRSLSNYESLVDELIATVHSSNSQAQSAPVIENEVFENHLRFIRHMEVYFQLRHSIKYGDIGLLRHALRDTCVIFQASEGGTFNYAAELIRLIHLYCSEASDVVLQEAMLANSLVNLQGSHGKFFETDRLLEYLNGTLKEGLAARRNSTKSSDELLKEIALTIPYNLQLRLNVHEFLNRYYRGNHPVKSVAEDLQIMAVDLLKRDMRYMEKREFSAYIAADLLRSGAANLGANVDKYNEKVQMGGSWDPEPQDSSSVPASTEERPGSPSTQLMTDIGMSMEDVHT